MAGLGHEVVERFELARVRSCRKFEPGEVPSKRRTEKNRFRFAEAVAWFNNLPAAGRS